MKKTTLFITGVLSLGGLLGVLVLGSSGCQSPTAPDADALAAMGMVTQDAFAAETGTARGAAEIWATTCIRCHNSRSAASYSDAQWDVAMLHMRIQANLTADEYQKILEFLKASN